MSSLSGLRFPSLLSVSVVYSCLFTFARSNCEVRLYLHDEGHSEVEVGNGVVDVLFSRVGDG